MAKWQVGAQVTAREDTILADGDSHDGIEGVGAGTLGVIVASHGTDVGLNGRFARRLSVRFPGGTRHGIGSDELTRQGGALGDVSPVETADARVADAVARLDSAILWQGIHSR